MSAPTIILFALAITLTVVFIVMVIDLYIDTPAHREARKRNGRK